MKSLFLKPIGKLQDLGTARVWVVEIASFLVCAIALVALLILL